MGYNSYINFAKNLEGEVVSLLNSFAGRLILAILLCIIHITRINASAPIILTDKTEEWSVTRSYVDYWEDKSAKSTISEVLKLLKTERVL